jgi:hypothetical protein
MTSAKVAVSLPLLVLADARRAVRAGRAASLSAYVADSIAERVKLDDLEALLTEMLLETGGPLTAQERRWADKALGVRPKRVGKKPRKGRSA